LNSASISVVGAFEDEKIGNCVRR